MKIDCHSLPSFKIFSNLFLINILLWYNIVLMFKQILLTSTLTNAWRAVGRLCKLNGLVHNWPLVHLSLFFVVVLVGVCLILHVAFNSFEKGCWGIFAFSVALVRVKIHDYRQVFHFYSKMKWKTAERLLKQPLNNCIHQTKIIHRKHFWTCR